MASSTASPAFLRQEVPKAPDGAQIVLSSGGGAGGADASGSLPLSLASLLSSLSYALDLTEGQPMGHAVRTCLIGMRIGAALGLSEDSLSHLHYALLLKDAGCSSNSARMFAIFGCDDLSAKYDAKISDWCRLSEAVKYAVTHTMPNAPMWERLQKMRELMRIPGRVMDALTQARCTRGADIARSLNLGEETSAAIFNLDEHWDGHGAAHAKKGEEIPLLARIACLAQTMEVFATTFDVSRAYAVARERSGRWFDPQVVRAAQSFENDGPFWKAVRDNPRALLEETTRPALQGKITETSIDAVCSAFAAIVDAKSSFTGEHSSRVCGYADEIAEEMGLGDERRTLLRRASLLHDLGKLAVPNLILDKPDRLTEEEFAVVKRHPYHTEQILKNIEGFERLTRIAAAHHEKLNGTGYFRGLFADDLDLDMRILAVADIFDALTAKRPYRDALPLEKVFQILDKDAGIALDADCIAALKNRRQS